MLAPGHKLDAIFTITLVLNTIQMTLYYDGASSTYVTVLDTLNVAFTFVYTVEAGLKIWAYGCTS